MVWALQPPSTKNKNNSNNRKNYLNTTKEKKAEQTRRGRNEQNACSGEHQKNEDKIARWERKRVCEGDTQLSHFSRLSISHLYCTHSSTFCSMSEYTGLARICSTKDKRPPVKWPLARLPTSVKMHVSGSITCTTTASWYCAVM